MTQQFVTETVVNFFKEIEEKCRKENELWYQVFQKTYANTLKEAIKQDERGNYFVLTGDIPAMWQRDSTAQIRPYLVLAKKDKAISDLIYGVVERQFFNMNLDPYANAFNLSADGSGHQHDHTEMNPWIWERKYELDSLCYPVQLAYLLYKNTGRTDQFDQNFVNGIKKLLHVFQVEQHHNTSPYRFERDEDRPEDTLVEDGRGAPVGYTGMVWSGFRPSDDACVYGYLIPANMFAYVILQYVQTIFTSILHDSIITSLAAKLASEIKEGIQKYGLVNNREGHPICAYEVDGLGHHLIMDDGNVPDLLGAPYLGYFSDDNSLYLETRKSMLSFENDYFYSGKYGSGLGSPHTPKGFIWPIALAMQGLTQDDREEKKHLLDVLVETDANTDMMHESFNVNDPRKYTREWFSWANMMYCELLLQYLGYEIER